jgi:hypothetical protein
MKTYKLIAALLSAMSIGAHAQTFQPDPKGIQFLKRLVAEDFQTYLQGGTSLLDYGLRRPDMRLTAHKLSTEYLRDPSAADADYTGKWILVGGGIRSGGTGKDGRPYLDIAGTQDSYSDVRAMFTGDIRYFDGAPVNLLCKSVGHKGGHPLLDNCVDYYHPDNFDPATQILPNYVNAQIDEWFSDGKVPAIGRGKLQALFDIYWAGTHLPPFSPGQTDREREEQLAPYFQMVRAHDPAFVAAYRQATQPLHLPLIKE